MKPVSGKRLVKVLEKLGWEVERVNGSHHFLSHPDGRTVNVPVHGNKQHGIMKDAGLTDDDL